MKWDFAIGNPPYQDTTLGDNDKFAPPVYDKFIDAAAEVAQKVELIHPARFLFNAGSTPKPWNEKMLNNTHFKVLEYTENAASVFQNTTITGGIAITYQDSEANYTPIGIFTSFNELNDIIHKVKENTDLDSNSLSNIAISSYSYHFTDMFHNDYPQAAGKMSKGHAYDLKSNVFERLTDVFLESLSEKSEDEQFYRVLGRIDNNRAFRFIPKRYIKSVDNTEKYKVVLSGADGAAGQLGNPIPARIIGSPSIGNPGDCSTESFMSIGKFDSEYEAQLLMKYLKSKFARVLIGIVKVTQNITPDKFKYVPTQDFSLTSDIDWTVSVPNIDRQLYKKYGLNQQEIDFIEGYVKEME